MPFPKNFNSIAKTIFKRLFRVYAHIYHQHFSQVVQLGEEAHLNTSFKHFIYFVQEFNLIDKRELAPLNELIDKLTGPQPHSQSSHSHNLNTLVEGNYQATNHLSQYNATAFQTQSPPILPPQSSPYHRPQKPQPPIPPPNPYKSNSSLLNYAAPIHHINQQQQQQTTTSYQSSHHGLPAHINLYQQQQQYQYQGMSTNLPPPPVPPPAYHQHQQQQHGGYRNLGEFINSPGPERGGTR